jgi:hypothetical protein
MANMSYCAFENTAADMDQLANMLYEAVENGAPLNQQMSSYESRAFDGMWEKCRALMELLEQHEAMVEEMKENSQEEC